MKIEIGSGLNPTPGYLGIDVDPGVCPGIVGNALALPVRSGSCEALVAYDVLEHVPWKVAAVAMIEWSRVLLPGGMLTVRVPDAESEMRRVLAQDPVDMARLNWHLLGFPHEPFQGHQTLYSEGSLRELVSNAGLTPLSCTRDGHPNLEMIAWKP